MLNRYEIKFNDEFVELFEEWLDASYPDYHWAFDKVYDGRGWQYKHEWVEDTFEDWLNCAYYMLHPLHRDIVAKIEVTNPDPNERD